VVNIVGIISIDSDRPTEATVRFDGISITMQIDSESAMTLMPSPSALYKRYFGDRILNQANMKLLDYGGNPIKVIDKLISFENN
jgi:hypothetical protein